MIGNSDDKINFPYEVASLRKAFANSSSTDIKLSKIQLSKMIQSGGFLGRLPAPLLKTGLPLMKNVVKLLGKTFLIPLGLTAATSAADAERHNNILGSGTRTLIISDDETEDFIKIVISLKDSGILLKGVSETIHNEAKKQKGFFLRMSLGSLAASLLGNILADKGMNRAGEGFFTVSCGSSIKKQGFLIRSHALTNF